MSPARSRFSFTRSSTRRITDLPPNRFNKTPLPRQDSPDQTLAALSQRTSLPKPLGRGRAGITPMLSAIAPARLTPTALIMTLPLPPSINHQYATVRGRRVLSSIGRRYKSEIGKLICSLIMPSTNRQRFLHDLQSHFLRLALHFYFPTLLRRDLDGGLKIAQDALCQGLGINDNRILEIHLIKSADASLPRMECTLSLLQPATKTRNAVVRKP